MRQWLILFKKELLEMARNFKWIWVPLTFVLLGVMDPITTYYLPKILDTLGGLPEGAVFEIPSPLPSDVLMMTVSQIGTLGVLIIVLISMGLISGERKSGVAGIILVKPVAFHSYITAKWAGALMLVWVSYFAGMLASWYYVGILFDWIPFGEFIQAFFLYGVWLTFVLTITVFYSTFFKTPGIVGFLSIATVILLSVISSSLSHLLEWSPAQLTSYTVEFLMMNVYHEATMPTLFLTLGGIVSLLVVAVLVFKKKELAA